MSTAAATPSKKKASKPKKPAAHPKYSEMVVAAIKALKERGGSSKQAILKYIVANYKVGDAAAANRHLKMALKAGVASKKLKQAKGTGASGSFRLGEEKAKVAKKAKKAAKPKVKKPKAAKKPAGEKKPKAKKAKTPKKKAAAPKVKKSPAKKASKPKKAKSPAKKAAKKAKSPKKAAKK